MKGLRLDFVPYDVRLKQPLVTARAVIDRRIGWWIKVWDAHGRFGFGEAAPLPWFGTEGTYEVAKGLQRLKTQGLSIPDGRPGIEEVLAGAGIERSRVPALYAGTELALLDYLAREQGVPVASLFSSSPHPQIPVQCLLSGKTDEALVSAASNAVAAGFRTLKLKVGARPIDEDTARVATLRTTVGPDIRLRLDANGAWDPKTAQAALEALALWEIDLVEQPVTSQDPAIYQELRRIGIPIAADEAMGDPEFARCLIEGHSVDAIVLKPTILGGLDRCWQLARLAAQNGMIALITTALDRVVGVAGAVHLAAAMPKLEVNGLGTLGMLEADDALLLPIADGYISLPLAPGLGVTPPSREKAS